MDGLVTANGKFSISDNPICTNGWIESEKCPQKLKEILTRSGFGCSPQCSEFCFNTFLEDIFCDDACNSPKCKFDNGACIL